MFLSVLAKALKRAPCSFHVRINNKDNYLFYVRSCNLKPPCSFHFLIIGDRSVFLALSQLNMDIAQMFVHFLIEIGDSSIIVFPVASHFLIKVGSSRLHFPFTFPVTIGDSYMFCSLSMRLSFSYQKFEIAPLCPFQFPFAFCLSIGDSFIVFAILATEVKMTRFFLSLSD